MQASAATVANDDLPSWGRTIAAGGIVVAVLVASQATIVYLLTGEWGGTPNDPLWVGPVSAALAIINTIGTIFAAALVAISREELERG